MEDLSGKRLGPYLVKSLLGEGGMAAVFKAYQASVDRYVALKVLPRYYASEPDFVHRFKQEAKVIANLQHPNILPVHDFGEADGYTYLVMRFVESGTLADLIKRQPIPWEKTCSIISQVGSALDYAHRQGVVHRDVKPSNVLIDDQGNCLLTDFGIAKIIAATSHLVSTTGFIGTPAYASPEQCLGQPLDGRSDVYSLGVMLYEMLTGRPPFAAETPMGVVLKHVYSPLPLPTSFNPAIPEPIERAVLKTLAKEPKDRFQTAGELAQALGQSVGLPAVQPTGARSAIAAPPKPVRTPIAPTLLPVDDKRKGITWRWLVGGLAIVALFAGLFWGGKALLDRARRAKVTSTGPFPVALATATRPFSVGLATSTRTPRSGAAPAPSGTSSAASISTPFVPTDTLPPSETPALPPITVLKQFDAPGNALGIAWDGKRLWVSEAEFPKDFKLLELDEAGKTTRVLISNIIYETVGGAIEWESDSLWLTERDGVHHFKIAGALSNEGSFEPIFTVFDRITSRDYAIAWNGKDFWLAQDEFIFKVEASGAQVNNVVYPKSVKGMAWDGSYLWVSSSDNFLDVLDQKGVLLASFPLPIFSVGDMAWDGTSLWALGVGKISQLDISAARQYVDEQAQKQANTPALVGVLQLVSSSEGSKNQVEIINKTGRLLTISFHEYNYSEQVDPDRAKTITLPGNSFAAEVPGLPQLNENWYFEELKSYRYTLTYELKGPVTPDNTALPLASGVTEPPTSSLVGTPEPIRGFSLPLTEPFDIIFDGATLRLLIQDRLVNLDLVEMENRFRAVEQIEFAAANSLAWDAKRGKYWVVRGAPWWVGEEIDLVNSDGKVAANFTVPKTFVGNPRYLTWDGEYLWATSTEGSLYKLQPVGESGELKEVDAYAPAIERYGLSRASGLAWDGSSLWLLVGNIINKLDQATQPVCKIELPSGYPQPDWAGWRGLTWDGRFLWVAHTGENRLYRVDPAECQAPE